MPSKAKILIIDDDAPIRHVLGQTLTAEGYEVATAGNVGEALEMCARDSFGVIMTDIIMPEQSGFQAISALASLQPDARLIAMSGGWNGSAESFLRMAGRMGVSRTLSKPFGKRAMLDAIEGDPPLPA